MANKLNGLIAAHVQSLMPEDVKNMVRGASFALWYGPFDAEEMAAQGIEDWPGYATALDQIEAWADDGLPSTLHVDTQAETVCEALPTVWIDDEDGTEYEPMLDDYRTFERHEIARIVFGELVLSGGLSV
jgi:hypothetical protein